MSRLGPRRGAFHPCSCLVSPGRATAAASMAETATAPALTATTTTTTREADSTAATTAATTITAMVLLPDNSDGASFLPPSVPPSLHPSLPSSLSFFRSFVRSFVRSAAHFWSIPLDVAQLMHISEGGAVESTGNVVCWAKNHRERCTPPGSLVYIHSKAAACPLEVEPTRCLRARSSAVDLCHRAHSSFSEPCYPLLLR